MRSKKILVVEDSRSFRQQITISIESRGYDVISAGDGREGLEMLSIHPDALVIITDINMPEMDGLEMVRSIKETGTYKGPIMILTTEGDLSVIEKGRALGVNCWLVKPFEPATLLSAIDKLLSS
jgi:two-component system, chemotaxis family, chemotaxis protein CheY